MTPTTVVLVALLALARLASASRDADAVRDLPLFGTPPSPQFSGYLDASAVAPGTKLHYWFAQHATKSLDDATVPVVLWLNGGPGSTSVLGMLQEHGPLLINATGGLMENPWAWTTEAHLVVLESPAGVGYSYCATYPTCNNVRTPSAKEGKETAPSCRKAALRIILFWRVSSCRAFACYVWSLTRKAKSTAPPPPPPPPPTRTLTTRRTSRRRQQLGRRCSSSSVSSSRSSRKIPFISRGSRTQVRRRRRLAVPGGTQFILHPHHPSSSHECCFVRVDST